MVQKTWTDTSVTLHRYDANGNRISTTHPEGNTETLIYDAVNRLVTHDHSHPTDASQNQIQTNAWDNNNNLFSVIYDNGHSSATATNQFDELDRQIQAVDRFGQAIDYRYDANGNRTRVQSPGGITDYQYDAPNRAILVLSPGSQTSYNYDLADRVLKIDHPGNIATVNEYDAQGRIERKSHKQGDTTLSEYSYSYDANNNRIGQTEINGGLVEATSYTYDDEDRLVYRDTHSPVSLSRIRVDISSITDKTGWRGLRGSASSPGPAGAATATATDDPRTNPRLTPSNDRVVIGHPG